MTERARMIAAAEAMRAAAIKVIGPDRSAGLRRRGYKEHAEQVEAMAKSVNGINASVVVDDLIHAPPPSLAEVAAFEAEAKRQFLNTRRNDKGEYAEYITGRVWLVWCAGARWADNKK